ncbi:embryo-specific protein ATS3A-like [Miscanthus floridulus]|uniref:embryo-specific protein ATS3A-like n=1 Tax=Miscanthus floridulus TaxID=154761 RepID=UPI00345A80D3
MATHGGLAQPLPLLLTVLLVALAPSSFVAAAGGRGTGRRAAAACTSTYTLRVKTACGSPAARTSDAVSVAFGDAYRNEVLARPLVVPTSGPGSSRELERCGTDTFRVAGPCGYGVCYLYLRRDGWAPEWVQVVQPGPRDRPPATATFYFGGPLPDGVWYGHDRCPKAAAAAGTNSSASPRG